MEYFNRIEFSTLPFIIIWHLLKLIKNKYSYPYHNKNLKKYNRID